MPPLDEDLQMRSIDVEGTERTFWIPDRRPRGEARLIIVFHDRGDTGLKFARRSNLAAAATAAGYNIIFPDALERVWDDHGAGRRDGADDDVFLTTLLTHLARRGEFSGAPPYVLGVGENGGAFAERIAREGVHALAGVVIQGGSAREASLELTPRPIHPVPLLLAAPPRAGSRRPGLRARLALNSVRGHGVVSGERVLTDWRALNEPAGVPTWSETSAGDGWALLTQVIGG